MKLYIKNLTINNIIKNDKLHIKYNNFNKIYSKEGIFIIENNSIIRLNFYEDQSPITYYNILITMM